MEFLKGKFNWKRSIIAFIFTTILEAISFYVILPAINVFSVGFWMFQLVFVVIFLLLSVEYKLVQVTAVRADIRVKYSKVTVGIITFIVVSLLVLLIGNICSAKIFNASKYASLIEIQEGNFLQDMPMTDTVGDIALMDTASAKVVGQRAIGSLSDVVSQYTISDSYSTIDFNGEPMKVASLEYDGFFKWFNNKSEGIPGYVMVDPVNFETKYVKLEKPIKYTPSGWFNDNLYRHLRFQYPTAIFGGYNFEIDNEGNPYYICPVMSPRVGMFGGYDVSGLVVCDPCTGDSEYYEVGDIPNWVDRVYDGDLLVQKYEWYGTLSNGFFNSIIGQKDCKITTDDYGYKVANGDVWVYTGVTSVTGDQSNIGFILINSRTCEAFYYAIAGAEEHSAMSAAEGQVQHLGYKASFPSIINFQGTPTYLMVLKDKSNLVKMYAMVNIEKYSIVATGTTQKEVMDNYTKLVLAEGEELEDTRPLVELDITVSKVEYITYEEQVYVYILDDKNYVYKIPFDDNPDLIAIDKDAYINVSFRYDSEEDEGKIREVESYRVLIY